MPYVGTESGRLFYTESKGESEEPAVVLIHGAGGCRLHWPAALRRLSGSRVYTLDLPGHGRSGARGRDSITGYADAVRTFMDQVGVSPATLMGHSMGGAVALRLTLRDSELVSGLVLVATGARLRVSKEILVSIEEDTEKAIDSITRHAWSQGTNASLQEMGRKALRDAGAHVLLGDFVACDQFDVMDQLRQIDVPTLVIAGSEDRLTPLKYSEFLAERIPGAQLVIVDGAGHMVMLESPQKVADAVQAFLSGGQ